MQTHRHLARGGILALLFVFTVAAPALAGPGAVGDPYPLTTCPVLGGKLGSMGDPYVFEHEGREIRLCCKGCLGKFDRDPSKYLTKIDEAIARAQGPYYPLDVCPITGRKFTAEKPGIDHVVANRLVRVCCKGCIQKIDENPAPVLARLDKAVIEARKKDYPLDTCVISGGKLGGMGAPIDLVIANRLIRVCCKGCVGKVRANPGAAFAKIDAARAETKTSEAGDGGEKDSDGSEGSGGGCGGGGCCGG